LVFVLVFLTSIVIIHSPKISPGFKTSRMLSLMFLTFPGWPDPALVVPGREVSPWLFIICPNSLPFSQLTFMSPYPVRGVRDAEMGRTLSGALCLLGCVVCHGAWKWE